MEVKSIRRKNLSIVLAEVGGPKRLAALVKDEKPWEPNYVSQLKSPKKSFGDKTARKIEEAAGKPLGWMDHDHGAVAKGAAVRLTKEGSDDAGGPELVQIRQQNAITSIRLALGAMASIMAAMRPEEGAAVAALFRSKAPKNFQDLGLGEAFLTALDSAVAASRAQPSTPRAKARG
jgi:hypothetical protein